MTTDLQVVALGSCIVEMTPLHAGADLTKADRYLALPSGATSNFSIALARLGVHTGFITRVGNDELGQWLLGRLNDFGVETEGLARKVDGQLTPTSFCWMDGEGGKSFYFYRFPGYCDPMGTLQADELGPEVVGRGEIFDFSEATIRKQPLRDIALQAARNARAAGRDVLYAVNYRPSSWDAPEAAIAEIEREAMKLADIVVMNRQEAELFTGNAEPENAVNAVAELGPKLIAITDGAAGAYISADRQFEFVAPRRVEVVYDVGAGDTFHAGLVAGYLRGLPAAELGRFASDAAALRISRSADMNCLPTWDEVEKLAAAPI